MTAEAAPHGIAIAADGRRVLATRVLLGAAVLLIVAVLLSLSVGPTGITLASLPRVIAAWLGGESGAATAREQLVLIDIRLPRTLLAVFVGASLAVAGAMMQGLFRNPLADPGLIGVSSGAALAAVATIALGNGIAAPILQPLGVYALPVTAFLGGAITTLALVGFAGRHGRLMIGTLLLAGVAIAAFAGALTGLIAYTSNDRELRDLTLWTMGSLGGASWSKVVAVLPFAALTLCLAPRLVRALNGFLLGEAISASRRRRQSALSCSRPRRASARPSPSPASSGSSGSSCRTSYASWRGPIIAWCCRVARSQALRWCCLPTSWRACSCARRNCRSASSWRRSARRCSCTS
jgi:iron complex transport system permease protein